MSDVADKPHPPPSTGEAPGEMAATFTLENRLYYVNHEGVIYRQKRDHGWTEVGALPAVGDGDE